MGVEFKFLVWFCEGLGDWVGVLVGSLLDEAYFAVGVLGLSTMTPTSVSSH
jgi:hypothetical protein